jgi:hypothetical protein
MAPGPFGPQTVSVVCSLPLTQTGPGKDCSQIHDLCHLTSISVLFSEKINTLCTVTYVLYLHRRKTGYLVFYERPFHCLLKKNRLPIQDTYGANVNFKGEEVEENGLRSSQSLDGRYKADYKQIRKAPEDSV